MRSNQFFCKTSSPPPPPPENQEKLFESRKYQKYISANISPRISSCFHVFTCQGDNQHQKHLSSRTSEGILCFPPNSFYICRFLLFCGFRVCGCWEYLYHYT